MLARLPDAFRQWRARVNSDAPADKHCGPGELAAFRAGAEWAASEAAHWLEVDGGAHAREPEWWERARRTLASRIRNWSRGLLDW